MDINSFRSFMEEVSKSCLKEINKENLEFSSGTNFEDFVCEKAFEVAKSHKNIEEENLEQTSNQKFPDLIYQQFGIEVKFSKNGWKSTGNSVKESTRIKDIEEVLMFFFRSDQTDIEIKPYSNVLSDVVVTHSPRYKIDMEQQPKDSVFSNIDMAYAEFRDAGHPMSKIREYMRQKIDNKGDVWYLDERSQESQAYIRKSRDLSSEEKDQLRVEIMILFPEIFSESNDKYFRASVYLLEEHQILSPNFRDWFSAGGKEVIDVQGEKEEVSQKINKLYSFATHIEERLEKIDEELLKSKWGKENIQNREEMWLDLLDEHNQRLPKIYDSSLT